MAHASLIASTYCAPPWLGGGHAQTIYPFLLARPAVPFRRERVITADGDFWQFDWLDAPADAAPDTPLARALPRPRRRLALALRPRADEHAARVGWMGVVAHFRGCGGELNQQPRAYHSGDHEEIDALLAAVRERVPNAPLYAVGVSLGGSALVNWLGRQGRGAAAVLNAAAAVSTPLDLTAAGIAIGQGLNRIYTRHFLDSLKPKSLAMARRYPGLLDERAIRRARSLYDFDDIVTAPLHGFAGTDDYWRRASSKPWLSGIAVPTLVLNARNDPFVPASSLPGPEQASADVLLEQPEHGGHVGFLSGRFPGRLEWLPERLLQFFQRGA